MNIEQLRHRIAEVAHKWDASGGIAVTHKQSILYKKLFGYQDRDDQIPINPNDTFLMSTRSNLLLGLSVLLLVDQNLIRLEDTIDQYIPEYTFGNQITIKDLIYHNTGIPDYYYEVQMLSLQEDASYQSQSQEEKFITEKMLYENAPTFQEMLSLIGTLPLTFIPGTRDSEYSYSNNMFTQEIIERLSKLSLFEFEKRYIFEPLGINSIKQSSLASTTSYGVLHQEIRIRLPFDKEVPQAILFTFDDTIKLMFGLQYKKLLSKQGWKLACTYNNSGFSPIGERVNGILCAATQMLGYEINLYVDFTKKLSYIHLTNEVQILKRENNEWIYLRKELRRVMEEETTYPTKPKLESFNEINGWDALTLSIEKNQETFVLDPKTTIAYSLMKPRERRLYVLTDSGRALGMMVLTINPKINHFHVDVLLVDKKYQHRGYGKFMLQKGLEILKKHGAKRIEIGVNRQNTPAIKLYQSLGFKIGAIYDEGMALKLEF